MLAMRLLPFIITLMLPAIASALSPEEVPNPQIRGEWIADEASLLDPEQKSHINIMLSELEAQTGVEVALVTLPSVSSPTPKDFAVELFNLWGVGKAGQDNGLLIVLVTGERRLEIETGYGLEAVLTDGWLKGMQEREMVPRFREGDFAAGLSAGVVALDHRLRQNPLAFGAGERAPYRSPAAPTMPWWVWLLGAGGVAGAVARRTWLRTCPECGDSMRILEEHEEDEHLNETQQSEEALGSVNYNVYECRSCGVQRIHGGTSWFNGYASCPDCAKRTLVPTSKILQEPTSASSGRKRVRVDCAHCPYTRTYNVILPRFVPAPPPPSPDGGFGGGFSGGGSGKGGGGSFGGGSSGGGGAGSNW